MDRLKPTQADELVEAVARAISNKAYDAMRAQGFSGGWDHDEFAQAIAKAAVEATQSYAHNEYTRGLKEAAQVAEQEDGLMLLVTKEGAPNEATPRIGKGHSIAKAILALIKEPKS